MVENLLYRICHPKDKQGHLLTDQELTPEQGEEVWQVMVETQFVPYFQTRENFFSANYMQHPAKRVWWLAKLFARFGSSFIYKARAKWRSNQKASLAEAEHQRDLHEQQNRPYSPHEWVDGQGARWYITPQGWRYQLPPEALPRPSETSVFNYISNTWQD